MIKLDIIKDQIELHNRGEANLVTALTEGEIGYWARRHNVTPPDNVSQAMADGWHQADQEIDRARERVSRVQGRKAG